MNKWLKIGTLAAAVAVIALLAFGTAAFAQGPGGNDAAPRLGQGYGLGPGLGFVDANGDGVCDNCTGSLGQRFVDANGDGVCDNCTGGLGQGFVDANGDGICDYYPGGQTQGQFLGPRWNR